VIVSLDSPRWKTLRHAYGAAGDVPDLIRAVEAEKVPDYRDGGTWFEVYSSLYHQHSTYSATYAALPHIVGIANAGTLRQRIAVMCLVGDIQVHGHADETIPSDLIPAFESAVVATKASSLETLREAVGSGITNAADSNWILGELLLAFGGLRHPQSGFVVQLNYLVCEGWNVEADCPSCGERMVAELHENGITSLRLNSQGHTEPESAKVASVDRATYLSIIARGQAVLARGGADWSLEETPNVLAALADECGDRLLATRILDLGTAVTCPYCGHRFELSKGLRAL
jgi:uncharacterized Zn-finger protein